jgi:hypothetical protein
MHIEDPQRLVTEIGILKAGSVFGEQKQKLGKGLRLVYTSLDNNIVLLVQVSHGAVFSYS